MPTTVLLGPQRHAPILREAVDALGVSGQIAAVTAGWEERELEDSELRDHLGGRTVNLEIYGRAEAVYRHDPELLEATRERHDRLRQLQGLYRLRLGHALLAARELMAPLREGANGHDPDDAVQPLTATRLPEELLRPEQLSAIDEVRRLDAHHLERVAASHAEFVERLRPAGREHVAQQREALSGVLDGCGALCIAGGHVAILLNRLRLFGLLELWGDRPVLAWSAGAMALSERIILFHDSPPQGAGDAEVLEVGLGRCADVVPLPHASRRLRLDDPVRVEIFARRFGPALCVALDEGARLSWDGERWQGVSETRHLTERGALEEVPA